TSPHQALITLPLDAPVIDRSSHLDSNVTQEQRDTAKAAAQELAAYHHNNPEGNPTHQTGPATHLDGTHQPLVTLHLDAPVIDRSSHLDSNVTQEQRDTAKAAAQELAAYHHNNPEGNPTHQTGPTTHLDGTHQPLVTPHLDAPVIDRSSHLDSNVTQEQRDSAKAAAQELAAYHHNNPEGNPTHQTGPATHLDGTHQPLVTPHLDAPVIDLTSHLDSNVTDAERNAARYAAYQHNNPEGNPTHQTGPATHLDGTHQDTVTPHLDAPEIDRTAHLDSNVTDAERNAARYAAYQHNNPEGNPPHQTDPAPHLDGQHNVAKKLTAAGPHQSEQRVLTAEKYADANAVPHNGIDGKNGVDGKDGQSITGKTGAKGKDADMTLVNANVVALRSVRNEQAVQGAYVQQNSANVALNRARIASNSAAINQNSHDIAANRKDIDENSKDIKRVGAMAQAVSSLHYNRNESGYAVAAGEYDSEASIAGGMQFRTSQDSAVTVQVSWDGNATGAGVGFHSNF
ncbi:YadA-like family protein, partial [Serratia fonticola]|uniref:YadA-like family protein n=1 Tax=Serratia fonticola TaxID=47917 RepID=UPI0024DE43D7